MATTRIADLYTPDIWIDGLREEMRLLPSIVNSPVFRRDARLNSIASGAGTTANIPYWADITDGGGEEIQVEATAPTTIKNITASKMVAVICNRVKKFGAEALSAQVSGGDPVREFLLQLADDRLKRRQTTLIGMLRALFGTGAQTPSQAQGALRTCRVDYFIEAGASATSANLIDADKVINTIATLGERRGSLRDGGILMHSNIRAALEIQDKESFKNGVESGLPFQFDTYRGIPVYVSDSLTRAGATSGTVYDTYILAPGFIGYGEKPQTPDTGEIVDSATLQMRADKDTNTNLIWDRTRFLMHINGTKWQGTPAGSSPTDTELATHGNWAMVAQTAGRLGGCVLRTNG